MNRLLHLQSVIGGERTEGEGREGGGREDGGGEREGKVEVERENGPACDLGVGGGRLVTVSTVSRENSK